jgi:TolB-like protein
MFTDMVGYTALGQRNESLSLALVEEQRKLIRPILARHNGREIKTIGDAFLVEFPNALDSVRCAYDIQRATREFNISLPMESRIHLRVGLHLGDVVESQGDISGDAVNVASRIEPLADDGGVCLTRQVYDQVSNKTELLMTSLGPKALKNVSFPVEVFKIVMPWETDRASASQADKKRIAVLPLANISHDPSDEYFADGMTEELINALSHVQGLKVIARTSVTRYKKTPKTISEIGKELGVGSVMEGSVRKAGDRVRVTTQLIDVATEEHLWSENYDRKVEDIFAIQSDVAGMVAEALKARLLEEEKKKLASGSTGSQEAYDRYLLARYGKTRDPFERLKHYEEAVRLDPKFALAYASLAEYYVVIAGDFVPVKESLSKAQEYVARALELDDSLATAWVARGTIEYQFEWDAEKAERSYKRAIELNPSEASAYEWQSSLFWTTGRFEEALQSARRSRLLNPYPPGASILLGGVLATLGRREEALREAVRLAELYPDDPQFHNFRALIFGLLGMTGEAVREMDLLLADIKAKREQGAKGWTAGVAPSLLAIAAISYAAEGQLDKVKSIIAEAEEASRSEYVDESTLGTLYIAAGEREKGVNCFFRAVEERDAGVYMYHPLFASLAARVPGLVESLESDGRYQSLLKRFGFG